MASPGQRYTETETMKGNAVSESTEHQMIDPLVAAIMEQSMRDSQFTTNALIEGFQRDNRELRATLAAIRDRIGYALDGPYMPTAEVIGALLWPAESTVARYMEPER